MKAQIFIATYRNDYDWVRCSLASIKKFSSGFLPPVVNVPLEDFEWMKKGLLEVCPDVVITTRFVRKNAGIRCGFMSAQIAMMRADEYCPEADFIFLIGSESFAVAPFTPEMYFKGSRPAMLVSRYSDLEKCHPDCLCWRPGTERLLGWKPELECMRRLPCVYPKEIYTEFREFVASRSPFMTFDDTIYRWDEIHRDTSEQNLLGAFAHKYFNGLYEWVDVGCSSLLQATLPEWPNPIATFWSHGGLDRPIDLVFNSNGVSVHGRTPRQVIKEVMSWG
jgi:hypothetical protein